MALTWSESHHSSLPGDLDLLEKERIRLERSLRFFQIGLLLVMGATVAFPVILELPLNMLAFLFVILLLSSYDAIIKLSKVTRKELEVAWDEIRTLKMSAHVAEGPTTQPFGTQAEPPTTSTD